MLSGIGEFLHRLAQSRVAVIGTAAATVTALGAAITRVIPWWLFFLLLLLAVAGILLFAVVRQWWLTRKDEGLVESVDGAAQRDIGQRRVREREAVKTLQAEWQRAVETLRRTRVGRQRRFLYNLPWYVVIGAPASGKTTAIANSGLRFPMGRPDLAGTGGTKNCTWFFADEAILLDTAGRYTFSDEHAPDREEWLEFLRLLRRYRPLAPINGLIVTVCADGLMTKDREQLAEDARVVREKIDELVRELAIQFPIYLLVTKCDLIEGFTDFFGRLPRRRLDEMLGWTNPSWRSAEPHALVREAMAGLRERVLAMRVQFLRDEERPDPVRKIYVFPEELRSFERSLDEFCDILLRETRYNESPFLRGLYLTSGLQTGTAISRFVERLGVRLPATQLHEERRSYFLKDLFQERLPADRRLVATSGQARGRRQVGHNVAIAAVAAVSILAALVTGWSYVSNRLLLNRLEDEMRAAIGPAGSPPPERVASLGRYVKALDDLDLRNRHRPLSEGWGLYQGYRAVEPARALFLERFRAEAYAPAVGAAHDAVARRNADRGLLAIQGLVLNQVLSRLLNGTQQEPPGPNAALVEFWDRAPVTEQLADSFQTGYVAYLRWRGADDAEGERAEHTKLVADALPALLTVERVSAWADRYHAPVLATDVPMPAGLANAAKVRGAFTPEAWTQRVVPLVERIDLLGDATLETTRRFRREYQARYFAEWLDFVTRPKEPPDDPASVATLLGPDSPYIAMVARTAEGAAIDVSPKPPWVDLVSHLAADKATYLANLDGISRTLRLAESDPPVAFTEAKGIFGRPPVGPLPGVEATTPSDAFGRAERWVTQSVSADDTTDPDDRRVRTRLGTLLKSPVYAGFGAFVQSVAQHIDGEWRRRVVDRCAEAESPADYDACYGRGSGAVWAFTSEFVDPFVERPGFLPKVRYTKKLPMNGTLAGFLGNVDGINATLFDGSGHPRRHAIRFESIPSDDPGAGGLRATRTVLSVARLDGEPWTLEHRQFPKTQDVTWSLGCCGKAEIKLFVGSGPGEERPLAPMSADGPMGLIQLLNDAERQGNEFIWTMPEGFRVAFLVTVPDKLLALGRGTGAIRPPTSLLQ